MKRKLLLPGLTVMAGILLVVVLFMYHGVRPTAVVMHGSLFVSDAGQSHGGFEYNAEWNASLSVQGSDGFLRLVLNVGLGDALQKHQFRITDFTKDSAKITMKIDGQSVVLIWQENDQVWEHTFDEYYAASWGSESPPAELRGTISPTVFPGLAEHYYVELRLR